MKTADQKFWERVQKSDGCWLWTGEKNNQGYGRLAFGGRGNRKRIMAHRLSLELHGVPLSAGAVVMHRCDTPLCVNPAHLAVGTQTENLADMRAKMRHNLGERNGRATTTAEQAQGIAGDLAAGIGPTEAARRNGVSRSVVQHIKSGSRWAHLAQVEG